MKNLLSTTTVLSLALMPVQPWPLLAQQVGVDLPTIAADGAIIAPDGAVLCEPTAELKCDPREFGVQLALDGVTTIPALIPKGGLFGGKAAAPEAGAQADPEIAADEPAEATADTPSLTLDSSESPDAAPDEKADLGKQLKKLAKEKIEQEKQKNGKGPKAAPAAEAAPVQEAAPVAEAPQEAPAAPPAAPAVEPVQETELTPAEPLPEEVEEAFKRAKAAEAAEKAAQAAATQETEVVPVDVPEVSEEAQDSVINLLTGDPGAAETGLGALLARKAAEAGLGTAPAPVEPGASADAPAAVTETVIADEDTRSSFEEFAKAPEVLEGGRKKSGLSDLEKAGLLALGAIVVGKVLSDGREVVANTGDRVVVRQPDGEFQVYKDDDTLLRRPGTNVRTESFNDGSTRTIVTREDGSQVVTIRDASGRVLRRAVYDTRGNETVLIDDLEPEERIDVSTLPRPRATETTISTSGDDRALRAELARLEAQRLGRSFSLRQIREIKEVRRLAASIDVDNITFDTGSAVIRTTEARKLADLGGVIADILDENPNEVFLVEGHTDAVGSAASNLTLSDRRAESVALALTEYFGIPPENMVVQGYGEYDLRVETEADERRNRRVAVRVITPLMRTASR